MTDTMTIDAAAELLHVHVHTLEAWARAGLVPAHRIGRRYLFLRAELLAWIADQPASRNCAPCPSTVAAEPGGSSYTPAAAARRLEKALGLTTAARRRNSMTAELPNSGEPESSASVRELHSRKPVPTG